MKYYFIVHTKNSISHIIIMIHEFRILIITSEIEKNYCLQKLLIDIARQTKQQNELLHTTHLLLSACAHAMAVFYYTIAY